MSNPYVWLVLMFSVLIIGGFWIIGAHVTAVVILVIEALTTVSLYATIKLNEPKDDPSSPHETTPRFK